MSKTIIIQQYNPDSVSPRLLVTLGQYSLTAVTFGNCKTNLRLIDGNELVDLVFNYYEQFDSKYKSIIPLVSVYVLQAAEE